MVLYYLAVFLNHLQRNTNKYYGSFMFKPMLSFMKIAKIQKKIRKPQPCFQGVYR